MIIYKILYIYMIIYKIIYICDLFCGQPRQQSRQSHKFSFSC